MTASAHPDRQGTREELAAALAGLSVYVDYRSRIRESFAPIIADALLPVVERLCDQRAAEALEEAADWFDRLPNERLARRTVARFLRDDAAALATGAREGQTNAPSRPESAETHPPGTRTPPSTAERR